MRQDCTKNGIVANIDILDWYHPDLRFLHVTDDLRVIAGDVLYKRALIAPFMTTVSLLMQHNGTSMLLCHVPRAGVSQADVCSAAEAAGLLIECISRSHWDGDSLRAHSSQEEINSAELYELRALTTGLSAQDLCASNFMASI